MSKIFYIFLFFSFSLNAIEIQCNFEEVYSDGSVQQGILLYKNQKLRYQYFGKDLYTIFIKKNNFYIVENRNKSSFQKIPNENVSLLKKINEIINDYPNIDDYYEYDENFIKIEKNRKKFIKRIIIITNEFSMSIYINNCEEKKFEERFFNYFPFYEYP